jgi:hypothetical protein
VLARSLALIAAGALVVAIDAPPAPLAQQQSFDGAYTGSLECERAGEAILRTPLAMIVRSGRVGASAPMFDIDGRQELSDTTVLGTVSGQGALHLGLTVFMHDVSARVDYTGMLDATGGTLTGTQVWTRAAAGDGATTTRTCTATFARVGSPGR